MAVVRLRGPLKELAGGHSAQDVDAATVGELLRALEAAQPALRGWILDERGRVRRHINVFVGAEAAGDDTAVGEDDRVNVLPAISGGSQ